MTKYLHCDISGCQACVPYIAGRPLLGWNHIRNKDLCPFHAEVFSGIEARAQARLNDELEKFFAKDEQTSNVPRLSGNDVY